MTRISVEGCGSEVPCGDCPLFGKCLHTGTDHHADTCDQCGAPVPPQHLIQQDTDFYVCLHCFDPKPISRAEQEEEMEILEELDRIYQQVTQENP